MKIAVLTDIHANYRALETVIDHVERWNPDLVFVAGDIVNRGPRSECCKHKVEEKRINDGWKVIRGNHEDYVIERDDPDDPKSGVLFDMYQPVPEIAERAITPYSIRRIKRRRACDFRGMSTMFLFYYSTLSDET